MPKLRHQARFTAKAGAGRLLARTPGEHVLDCHPALESRIPGFVDLAHAPQGVATVGPETGLKEEFLKPLGLTQRQLANHIDCDVKVISRIVNGRASVTPEMALKLGAAFQTSPELWLNAQKAVDLGI